MGKVEEKYRALGGLKPYEDREKWALESLASTLEQILGEFEETEQEKIRPKLGNYAIGYLGVSFGLKYG